MSRSVYQVQAIALAIIIVIHLYGMAFDCDSSFTFKIHIVEHLCLHVLGSYSIGIFQKSVGKGALAMVYMGYDTEVPYIFHQFSKFGWLQIYNIFF